MSQEPMEKPPASSTAAAPTPSDANDSAEDSAKSIPRDTTSRGGLVEKGKFNHCIGVLGAPGTGKSTYALARAVALGNNPGAYVFAHDLGWKLPEQFPNGKPTGIKRYDSIAAAKSAIAGDARGVHCVATLDAKEVIELGSQTALSSVRANGGKAGVPSVVLIDEVVSAADANPYRLGEELRATMALRRHRHTGIIWTSQSPNLCHYQMMCIGTELVIFRLINERDLKPLRDAGVGPEVIEKVKTLPNYHYVIHKLG